MIDVRRLPSPGDGIAERIAEAVRERTALEPVAGVVLGSGLSTAVDTVRASSDGEEVEIAYTDLPGFPPPTVAGHAGRLWIGSIGARALAIFQGRVHFYEGHGMALASITSRLSAELGARAMMLTAATGALDPEIEAGTLVVLRDHLNFMGENPLHGWRFPDGSPAFVDVSQVYDPDLSTWLSRRRAGGSTARIGRVASATASTSRSPAPRTRRLPRHGCCGSSALRSWGCRRSPKRSRPGRAACGCLGSRSRPTRRA